VDAQSRPRAIGLYKDPPAWRVFVWAEPSIRAGQRSFQPAVFAVFDGVPPLTSAEFCNGCKVAKATHEHCCHPREQDGTDLEAGEAEHTANAREYGDDAQKRAAGTANATNPQQKDCHA